MKGKWKKNKGRKNDLIPVTEFSYKDKTTDTSTRMKQDVVLGVSANISMYRNFEILVLIYLRSYEYLYSLLTSSYWSAEETNSGRMALPISLTAVYSSQTYRHAPIALYSLLNVAPDDGLMIVRNMYSFLTKN